MARTNFSAQIKHQSPVWVISELKQAYKGSSYLLEAYLGFWIFQNQIYYFLVFIVKQVVFRIIVLFVWIIDGAGLLGSSGWFAWKLVWENPGYLNAWSRVTKISLPPAFKYGPTGMYWKGSKIQAKAFSLAQLITVTFLEMKAKIL